MTAPKLTAALAKEYSDLFNRCKIHMPASTKHAPSDDESENLAPPIIRPKATVYSGRDSVLGALATRSAGSPRRFVVAALVLSAES
jgi:hypothetical protein